MSEDTRPVNSGDFLKVTTGDGPAMVRRDKIIGLLTTTKGCSIKLDGGSKAGFDSAPSWLACLHPYDEVEPLIEVPVSDRAGT